jgi:hypothetical protein
VARGTLQAVSPISTETAPICAAVVFACLSKAFDGFGDALEVGDADAKGALGGYAVTAVDVARLFAAFLLQFGDDGVGGEH